MDRRLTRAALAAGLALAAAPAVHAAPALGGLPLALAAAASLEQGRCASAALPAAGPAWVAPAPALSKAAAILGGQVSALERMKQAQAGLAVPPAPALAGAGLVPAAGGECAMFLAPQGELAALRPGRLAGAGEFLASRRLPVRKTGFDAQWARVRRETVSPGLARGVAALAPAGATPAGLAAVNGWVNARVRYVEDRELYRQADYWAGARATLRRGAGDCEDIALAKLALLAALGVRRDAMFLTIARDLARNADHALLVVRLDGRFWLLDNSTDRVLDAAAANDYRPILSYSAGGKWLHGY